MFYDILPRKKKFFTKKSNFLWLFFLSIPYNLIIHSLIILNFHKSPWYRLLETTSHLFFLLLILLFKITFLIHYSFLNYVLSASRVYCLSYSFLCLSLFLSFPALTLPTFLKQAYVQILSDGSQDTVPSLNLWLNLPHTILPAPLFMMHHHTKE